MPDLAARIRERVEALTVPLWKSPSGLVDTAPKQLAAPLLAILDEHPAVDDGSGDPDLVVCKTCCGPSESWERLPLPWPCPTVRKVAEKLGIIAGYRDGEDGPATYSWMDIAEFLTARHDEQRRLAEAALAVDPAPWSADVCPHPDWYVDRRGTGGTGMLVAASGSEMWDCEGSDTLCMSAVSVLHIAAHDPARVLADLAAKRAILDEHSNVNGGDCGTCVVGEWGYPTNGGSTIAHYPCRTLRLLAAPYAEHPEYDPAWRIDA